MSKVTRRLGVVAVLVTGMAAAGAQAGWASGPRAPQAAEQAVCGPEAPGFARCNAHRRTDVNGRTGTQAVTPSGYGPADIRAAYRLPWDGTAPAKWAAQPMVAIVDAYDDPNAEKDLGVYRSQYGLPACTTANGCFKKVSQTGSTKRLPRGDTGWGQEISLDVDMVSAACPTCRILLVEATSNSYGNLATAVKYAASQHPAAISNSYGGGEWSGELSYDSYYNQPGIAVTASTGDNGYQVQYPAASPTVIAVGGTSLNRNASSATGFAETAWSGAGSGCSLYEPKPSFQTAATACNGRAVADVSAVADPATGVAVYDTYVSSGAGWAVFGGTSAASPIVASVYALAAQAGGPAVNDASSLYANPSALNDVTSGSNGTCSPLVWCTAGPGGDGPTGLGTPNGTTAF